MVWSEWGHLMHIRRSLVINIPDGLHVLCECVYVGSHSN